MEEVEDLHHTETIIGSSTIDKTHRSLIIPGSGNNCIVTFYLSLCQINVIEGVKQDSLALSPEVAEGTYSYINTNASLSKVSKA